LLYIADFDDVGGLQPAEKIKKRIFFIKSFGSNEKCYIFALAIR
jgi:hypothetical protein